MAIDGYTKSLLHFNGANGSTIFTDESGKIWTAYGNAQISTAQYKFGGASAYFDGSSYITTPATTDFQFGSSNFTIDLWALIFGSTADQHLLNMGGVYGSLYPDIALTAISQTQVKLACYVGSTNVVSITSSSFTSYQWHHIAVIRNGSNFYLAVDGTLSSPANFSGTLDYDSSQPIMIGYQTNGNSTFYFSGHEDEFRALKGIARWTSNFTPPTRQYGAMSGSVCNLSQGFGIL